MTLQTDKNHSTHYAELTLAWLGHMVKTYISSCTNCACTKALCHRPYGKLKQLPIPEKAWNSISMDFIKHLPATNGFTSILVVMDCLTKQSLFIPTYITSNPHQHYHLIFTPIL